MHFNEFISKHGIPLSKSAGDHVFRQGDNDQSLYVVKSGLLKAYYLSNEGKENIKSFIEPGDNIGSLLAAHRNGSCRFSLLCLKSCELIKVDFRAIYQASLTDIEMATAVGKFLLAFAMKKEHREYELLCLSAEERYRILLCDKPELIALVTQNDLARYLGVTPVSLSRIKQRIQKDN